MVDFRSENNGFQHFLSLYLAFLVFRGAIWLLSRYMVLWEKPHSQKVVCQRKVVVVDFGI